MKLILLGGPGAGKGTQADLIKVQYGIPHISTGEVLREARAAGTELGKKAAEYMDAGLLLPDEIILGIVDEKLKMPEMKNGFLFDGFPRNGGNSLVFLKNIIIKVLGDFMKYFFPLYSAGANF